MKNLAIAVLALGVVSGSAMASGFRCEGQGYNVKMYNTVSGATRKPSVLVVSHEDASPKTLLTAKGSEIGKRNLRSTVQYVTDGSEMNLDTVILQISFKEGQEVIEAGDVRPGQLILVGEEGREVIGLDCVRYLKN